MVQGQGAQVVGGKVIGTDDDVGHRPERIDDPDILVEFDCWFHDCKIMKFLRDKSILPEKRQTLVN
jgi:hypothetical protein